MQAELQATEREITAKVTNLSVRTDVAGLLEITDGFLCKVLYGLRERRNYTTFEIPKKSGRKRVINKPPKNLAIMQAKLNHALRLAYRPKKCVHGFARKRSIVSNAEAHQRKRHILNIDLKDFFPSIHLGRVKGALMKPPYNMGEEAAEVVAQICCLDSGELPQGGATSPILSNLICRRLDGQLLQLAERAKCRYSRYADDMTFSGYGSQFPESIAIVNAGEVTLGDELVRIIQENQFAINCDKVRYSCNDLRQEVTGLTVNEFTNVKRSFVLSIASRLHVWEKYGYKIANTWHARKLELDESCVNLANVLKGKLAFLKMVLGSNAPILRKMGLRYNHVAEEPFGLTKLEEIDPYPLRGAHFRADRWDLWFDRYKQAIPLLEIITADGDKRTGSAFMIGKNLLATARHNLEHKSYTASFESDEVLPIDESQIHRHAIVDAAVIRLERDGRDVRWLMTQCRLPRIGEPVAAIGYPELPLRDSTMVLHNGVVEALPVTFDHTQRFIQVSFQSGGGLSGAPLIDNRGFVVGIMVENIFQQAAPNVPDRPFGQAVPIEYLYRLVIEENLLEE